MGTLSDTASEMEMLAQNLGLRVQDAMKGFGLIPGDTTGLGSCDAICKSGVVMELYLTPVCTLRELMLWGKNDNCI